MVVAALLSAAGDGSNAEATGVSDHWALLKFDWWKERNIIITVVNFTYTGHYVPPHRSE